MNKTNHYSFLQAAELVLREEKRPLDPKTLFAKARNYGITSKGRTPASSMRARISSDIREKGFNSVFMRVGPNRFSLREFGLPKEYIAQPFVKEIPNEIVTCVRQEALSKIRGTFGFSKSFKPLLKLVSEVDNLFFFERKKAEKMNEYKQLVSYVLLTTNDQKVLTYTRGRYSSAHQMLKGARCLGFGGHVQDIDLTDIFGYRDGGVSATAEREIREELKGIVPQNLKIIGFINDDSSPEGVKHIALVLHGKLPADFSSQDISKELSVKDLRLMSENDLWNRYYEFEFWSQLLIKNLYKENGLKNLATIRPLKRNPKSNILVIVGEIASGKTVLAEMLVKKLGFHSVSTRLCVAKLIGMKDFGTQNRTGFQTKASKFIESKSGPTKLAKEIKTQVRNLSGRTVVDGIRQLATLKNLRSYFPNLTVLYVDSSRDDAFRNYQKRVRREVTLEEFRKFRFHEVEKEIPLLKYESDAYIFNGGNKRQLLENFKKWFF